MGKANITAADLRAKLNKLDDATIGAAIEKAKALEKAWRALLVDDDAVAIGKAEAALRDARMDAERLEATRAELESRIVEADAQEKRDRLDAKRMALEAEGAQLREMLARDYPKHAKALKAIGVRLAEFDRQRREISLPLSDAGFAAIGHPERETLAANDATWTELQSVDVILTRLPYV